MTAVCTRQRLTTALATVLAAAAFATPGVVAPVAAAQQGVPSGFGADAAHSGVQPGEAPRTLPRVLWTFPTGERIVSSAAYAEGVVYVGSDDGNLYAIDAESGRQRWMHRTGGPVSSSPAVADGRVYVLSYDGRLHALNARSGELLWKFATGGERRFEARGLHGQQPRTQTFADPFDVYLSSPVVAEGRIYFGSSDGHVYALDAEGGELRWSFRTGEVVHASPAYAAGRVVVGSWDGRLHALDAATGRELWQVQTGVDALMANQQGFQSSPAITGDTVIVGCRDAHLYAFDLASGRERWRFPTGMSWVVTTPAVQDGRVHFATSDSSLVYALDQATGRPLWQQQASAFMFASPSLAGGVLLQGVLNGSLQARDRATGGLLWEFRTEAARANNGWALSRDGRFNAALLYPRGWHDTMAIGAARQEAIGSFFATPLVVGRTIYVGSADGRLYALR